MLGHRLLLAAALLISASLFAQATFDRKKLIGEWRYADDQHENSARYIFREAGTFTAELRHGDEVIRKYDGLWNIEDEMLVYAYTADSLEKVPVAARERDRLVRVDDSSYTIEAGDRNTRTYWRVK